VGVNIVCVGCFVSLYGATGKKGVKDNLLHNGRQLCFSECCLVAHGQSNILELMENLLVTEDILLDVLAARVTCLDRRDTFCLPVDWLCNGP
jgi:hypothetical protein